MAQLPYVLTWVADADRFKSMMNLFIIQKKPQRILYYQVCSIWAVPCSQCSWCRPNGFTGYSVIHWFSKSYHARAISSGNQQLRKSTGEAIFMSGREYLLSRTSSFNPSFALHTLCMYIPSYQLFLIYASQVRTFSAFPPDSQANTNVWRYVHGRLPCLQNKQTWMGINFISPGFLSLLCHVVAIVMPCVSVYTLACTYPHPQTREHIYIRDPACWVLSSNKSQQHISRF